MNNKSKSTINLSVKESSNLAKVMNWEIKSSIKKSKLKEILKKWKNFS